MKLIDLSYELKQGIPCFNSDWHVNFVKEQKGSVSEVGRNTSKLIIGSHSGTHIDSPRHFYDDGITTKQISLDVLCGPVTIVDLTNMKKNEEVTVDMLTKYRFGKRVVFVFGWCDMWESGSFYEQYPYFTSEAAQYLVDEGVVFVGMDTPSPDDSRTKLLSKDDSKIHKLFLSNGVVLCEYLNNTTAIDFEKEYNIIALPILIDCDGSPARVVLQEI